MSIKKHVQLLGNKVVGYVDYGRELSDDSLPEATNILTMVLERAWFAELEPHLLHCDPLDNHIYKLSKMVEEYYFKIRLHHITEETNLANCKGKVLVVSVPDLAMKASFRVTTGTSNTTAIKSIEFARRGDLFLVNTADRIIRVYNASEVISFSRDGEPKPLQKLQDLVNKTTWKKCCFSGDGEYICAGSAREHALYIWEKSIGNLVKILHGTKGELLLDVVWHPVRPIIASISSGVVSLWAQQQVENWSAFAPDFKELDENVEYEERESEFDLEDEDASPPRHMEEEQDGEVDVETVEPIAAFCSRTAPPAQLQEEGQEPAATQATPEAQQISRASKSQITKDLQVFQAQRLVDRHFVPVLRIAKVELSFYSSMFTLEQSH
ncbi:hypothetical protein HPB48_006843 [Haemaphysalis longicornis]|uniref:Uncharacterized protein n=1 Tax=Haemaphysalis longicornis TaxID=44386 RepID=A0A9J6FFX9_HAELO|nr:hypothetical protein HPB48_006843 [Haemaphysalis longicornis]